MNKQASFMIGGVVLAVVCFAGGVCVGSKTGMPFGRGPAAAMAFRNGQGAEFPGGANADRGGVRGGMTGGFGVNGTVDSRTANSLVVKLPDGTTKTVSVSGETTVTEFITGKTDDVKVGDRVSVRGTANTDGMIVAATVQIQAALPTPAAAPTK